MPISARKEILREGYRKLLKHRHSQKAFLSFLAMAVMVSTAFGLGSSPASQEQVLLWEKEFDEEVVDVIFGEAEMTVEEARALGYKGLEQKKLADTVKVQYPKVLMIKDKENSTRYQTFTESVKFLGNDGSVTRELSLQRYIPGEQRPAKVSVSKNKKYLSINTPMEGFEVGDVVRKRSIILDDTGRELWELKHDLHEVHLSQNGKYIVGYLGPHVGGPIYVYNEKGLVREIEMHDISWSVGFSKEGSYFAVTIRTIDSEKIKKAKEYDRLQNPEEARKIRHEARKAHLIVFDDKGNELWRRKNIAKGSASASCSINISDDDIITVTTGVPEFKVYRFDKEGNSIQKESKLKEE
jgi:hypothetical protein